MTSRARLALFGAGAVGCLMLLVISFWGLPPFGAYQGPYGDVVARRAVEQRHSPNVPTSIVFDYRGFDTIGEELILFAAVMGVAMLLRSEHKRSDEREDVEPTGPIVLGGLLMIPPTLALGANIVMHGHLTPGGGFQGGALLGVGAFYLLVTGRTETFRRMNPTLLLDGGEAFGAGGFVAVGLLGLFAGGAYMENVLPLGPLKTVFSSGTIALCNAFASVAVAAAFVFMMVEFQEQSLTGERR